MPFYMYLLIKIVPKFPPRVHTYGDTVPGFHTEGGGPWNFPPPPPEILKMYSVFVHM